MDKFFTALLSFSIGYFLMALLFSFGGPYVKTDTVISACHKQNILVLDGGTVIQCRPLIIEGITMRGQHQ